ncbi:hypothetical protein JCGZ_26484 [Jatropha curcas]|uniref:Glycine-rich protein n=2 Tax=Jatropha curcas TaxID=180498 RepID=A0A067LGS4_JATCU|nr:hypothetical protein JCGZ_26484 [Jatropha curcas]
MALFLIVFFFYLYLLASSFPLHKPAIVSDFLQEHNFGPGGRHENEFNGRNGIIHVSKYAHGSGGGVGEAAAMNGGGANGGGSTGAAEGGNGNGNTQGGQAVIPVIVAGAANNNRHQRHRGAASCNKNCIRFPAMIVAASAIIIVHLCVAF